MNNLLFLDIDGVVNTLMIYKEEPPHLAGKKYLKRDGYIFDICSPSDERVSNLSAVAWLDLMCHKFNFKIVISSTWRLGHFEETKKALYNSGLSEDIEIVGQTLFIDGVREKEIADYLCKHPKVDDFIILDDDVFDLGGMIDYVIKTDTHAGITADTYNQVKMHMARLQ